MLSYLTKTRFCEWLLEVSDKERRIESLRLSLCRNPRFEPYAAFKRITKGKRNQCEVEDIQKFQNDNEILSKELPILRFVKHYSQTSTPQLTYTEFLYLVLPVSNQSQRSAASQRPNYEVSSNYLHSSVENELASIISYEINSYDELSISQKNQMNRPDFNVHDLFRQIDLNKEKVINFHNLKRFFQQQGQVPFEEEIIEIQRRIDKDDDGTILYLL